MSKKKVKIEEVIEEEKKNVGADLAEAEKEVEDLKLATKEDIDGLRSAIQELTKVIGDLVKENTKWFNSGRFSG